MDAESFVEKVKSGTITQSEAEEVNKSQVLRLVADAIKALPSSRSEALLSEEEFNIIMNCGQFIVLNYNNIDCSIFAKMIGREALMQSSNKIMDMWRVNDESWNPWVEIFRSLLDVGMAKHNGVPVSDPSAERLYKIAKHKSTFNITSFKDSPKFR